MSRSFKAFLWIMGFWFAFWFVVITVANAHSWYPQECCSENDCHPVEHDELVQDKDGCWVYTVNGTRYCGTQVRPSKDKHSHVCYTFYRNDKGDKVPVTPYCAFIQMNF